MKTEKSQPDGKWIMPEMRFTEFPALSVDPRAGFTEFPALFVNPRIGISRSALETDDWLFFSYLLLEKNIVFITIFLLFPLFFTINDVWLPTPNVICSFSLLCVSNVCKQLASLLVSRVTCLIPWAKQIFSVQLKQNKLCFVDKKWWSTPAAHQRDNLSFIRGWETEQYEVCRLIATVFSLLRVRLTK